MRQQRRLKVDITVIMYMYIGYSKNPRRVQEKRDTGHWWTFPAISSYDCFIPSDILSEDTFVGKQFNDAHLKCTPTWTIRQPECIHRQVSTGVQCAQTLIHNTTTVLVNIILWHVAQAHCQWWYVIATSRSDSPKSTHFFPAEAHDYSAEMNFRHKIRIKIGNDLLLQQNA